MAVSADIETRSQCMGACLAGEWVFPYERGEALPLVRSRFVSTQWCVRMTRLQGV